MHCVQPTRTRHRHRRPVTIALARPPAPRIGMRRTYGLDHLQRVSLCALAGFFLPLPFVQLGHWLFGWSSVAVMVGGLG